MPPFSLEPAEKSTYSVLLRKNLRRVIYEKNIVVWATNSHPLLQHAQTTINDYLEERKPPEVKLHLGCGGVRWQDFINVDLHPHDSSVEDSSRNGCVADVFADMRALGLPDNSIDEIFTSHTIDHFTRWVGD